MKLAAPTENGQFLAVPGFDAIERLVESNRKTLDAAHGDLRRHFRSNWVHSDNPIILTGHQPELFHPGVWVKTFAATGLARRLGGTAINILVDTDTLKSTSIRLPRLGATPDDVTLASLAFDEFDGETTYESRRVKNPSLFATFGDRLQEATLNWPFEPCGLSAFAHDLDGMSLMALGYQIDNLTRIMSTAWGDATGTLPVSELARVTPFRGFVERIMDKADDFRDAYNAAILAYRRRHRLRSRNHPAAELEPGELPFWTMDGPHRRRTWKPDAINYDNLRPKALVLTLFARLILGDFFIHGLGGGKYDEVTDDIIRTFFKIEPPAYQILTGTLHLPFPALPTMRADVQRARNQWHRDYWNPHRLLNSDDAAHQHREIVNDLTITPRERYQRLRTFNERLRPSVATVLLNEEESLRRMEREWAANAILNRRDYAWILYPESVLKPFLQQFLQ